MTYGAAVVYTGKDGTNKDRLYRYLLHRAYGFPLKDQADITKPETTFIPSGAERALALSLKTRHLGEREGGGLELITCVSSFA